VCEVNYRVGLFMAMKIHQLAEVARAIDKHLRQVTLEELLPG
jgi:hypothetical protein